MKVSFSLHPNISFKSRNSKIRTADQVMRTSKNTFPVVSSSYIDVFYNSKEGEKTGLKRKMSDKIYEKIENIRELERRLVAPRLSLADDDKNVLYAPILQGIAQLRSGNCNESAVATLGALAANKLYDSSITSLYVDTKYFDKETGEIVFERRTPVDHCFVISTMSKPTEDKKDIIVLDSWLSFCDSVAGAMARYKSIFQDSGMKEALNFCESQFRFQKMKNGEEFNENDYDVKQKLSFTNNIPTTSKTMEDLGNYCCKKFPSLIINTL